MKSYLDGLFSLVVSSNGAKVANASLVDFSSAFTVTLRTDGTLAINVANGAGVTPASVVAALAGASGVVSIPGEFHAAGGLFTDSYLQGLALSLAGEIADVTAVAVAAGSAAGGLLYVSETDHSLKWVSKSGIVTVLAPPVGGTQRGTVQTIGAGTIALSPAIAFPWAGKTAAMRITCAGDNVTDDTQAEISAVLALRMHSGTLTAPAGTVTELCNFTSDMSVISIGTLVDVSYGGGAVLVKAKGVSGKTINWTVTATLEA